MPMLLKMKWAILRLHFMFWSVIGILTFGLAYYIFMPVYTWYFFNDVKFYKYHRYGYRILGAGIYYFLRWMSSRKFRKMFAMPLTAPPQMAPDHSKLRLQQTWSGSTEHCNGCIICCTKAKCSLIDHRTNTCMSYRSFYWRYFHCGRFPENQFQIDYYGCPKWEIT